MHRIGPARITTCALVAALSVSAASCAAIEDYSRRVGRNACRSAGTCTVYDQTGAHQEPCWPTQEGQMAYPGDPDWPFEHGVCDTVAQMNAPWPELSGTTPDTSASTAADTRTTAVRRPASGDSGDAAGVH